MASSGGSSYFHLVSPKRRNDSSGDIQRGLAAGESIGKLLGGLGTAIKGAQKDALANQLMDQQSISEQPGAGQTIDLGTTDGAPPGGPQPGSPQDLPPGSRAGDPDPDPDPTALAPPGGGGINPDPQLSGSYQDMPDLSQAVSQQKAATSLQAQPGPPSDFTLNPGDYSGGGGKGSVGGLVHTGGVQEMELQKEMLAMQMQKSAAARQAAADAQDAQERPLNLALKQAQLATAQQKAVNPGKPVKTPVVKPEDIPVTNLDSEPVDNQAQLNKHVDTIYGKGAAAGMASTVMNPPTIDDPKNPGTQIPNPNGPQVSADGQTVTVGPKNKRITMPIKTAQTLIKQQNALNFKQNQPLLRVPGETDQTMGATADNPYPVNSKLDMVSRAHGTWVRLPNGQVAQVP